MTKKVMTIESVRIGNDILFYDPEKVKVTTPFGPDKFLTNAKAATAAQPNIQKLIGDGVELTLKVDPTLKDDEIRLVPDDATLVRIIEQTIVEHVGKHVDGHDVAYWLFDVKGSSEAVLKALKDAGVVR